MKNNKIYILLGLLIAAILIGCTQPEPPHLHTFSNDWTTDDTAHWHAATCEHSEEVKGEELHKFPEIWTEVTVATEEADGLEERFCEVCNYRATQVIPQLKHNHDIATTWTTDSTKHWHAASCGREEHNEDAADHTEDSGTVTTAATCGTKGVKTFKCSVCKAVLRTEEIAELYSTPIDVTTGATPTAKTEYIYFGVFPRGVLPETSTVTVDETVFVKMGANTYYLGSDGNYYAKCAENAYGTGTEYKYHDGTQAKKGGTTTRYFKVEPIKWRVLTDNYSGKKLLLAEEILTANVPYYDFNFASNTRTVGSDTNIYPNNYKYSQIRAYLNGFDYYYDTSSTETTKKTDYIGKGFLQTAFTLEAQVLIEKTVVDNSPETTGYDESTYATYYACENTTDKIFLLSESEVIKSDYGFEAYNSYGEDNARIRFATDYAKANYAYQSSTEGYGGYWWLRSPYDISGRARLVYYDGNDNGSPSVNLTLSGVVPALSISF